MTAGRKITQNKQNWNTPTKYVNLIHKFFDNDLELDPCSNTDSIVEAKRKVILPENGLDINWVDYSSIYINPPYGRDYENKTTIKNWIQKAYHEWMFHNAEILMLIPVATNTSHWKQFVFGSAYICFLNDTRLVFRIGNEENNKGCPMACAMIYYGQDVDKFKNIFGNFGYITS